jgi:hypothetical protein
MLELTFLAMGNRIAHQSPNDDRRALSLISRFRHRATITGGRTFRLQTLMPIN